MLTQSVMFLDVTHILNLTAFTPLKIVATVLLAIVVLFTAGLAYNGVRNGISASRHEASGASDPMLDLFGPRTDSGTFYIQAGLSTGLMLASIFGIVAAFSPSRKRGTVAAVAVGVFSLAFFAPMPGLDMGNLRSANYLIALIGLGGAIVLFLLARKRAA